MSPTPLAVKPATFEVVGQWKYSTTTHDVGYCPLCDGLFVMCSHCGNSSCNGGGCDKCCGTTCDTNFSLVFSDNYKDIVKEMEIELTPEFKQRALDNNKELRILDSIFGSQTSTTA